MITLHTFNTFLLIMAAVAVVVFIALFFIKAGYGVFFDPKWGPAIPNKIGWFLMEVPVFITMTVLWIISDRTCDIVPLCFFIIFQTHYFQRSFIFPLLIRGNNKMALGIILMGAIFNTLNAMMQGGWIFFLSPQYPVSWLGSAQFIAGLLVFITGMAINIDSDRRIRNLRKPGDTKHYIPRGGMFRYVSSANYLGEFIEWSGFAILTWSWSGAVFALWTLANLAPRANSIYRRYEQEFGEEFKKLKLKRMIPFIY